MTALCCGIPATGMGICNVISHDHKVCDCKCINIHMYVLEMEQYCDA